MSNTINKNIEALKWLALLSMTLDHINKYLFNGTLDFFFEIGRIALPLFCFVLAFNLARPNVNNEKILSISKRIFIFALISTPFHTYLGNIYGVWPLNILFSLSSAVLIIYLINIKRFFSGFLIFIVSGFFVEFYHLGLIITVSIWAQIKYRNYTSGVIALLSISLLYFINENHFALLSIFIIFLFHTPIKVRIKRMKMFFYIFYPLHLFLLIMIRIPMSQAGYLFFT